MTILGFVSFIILISFTAFADCQYSDGTKTVTLKEGQSVSLRSPGKSLENFKIQDQDGLNTCYANATSTVLKTLLPGHPDISYTHAAIMGTTRGWQEDWSEGNKKYLNKKDPEDNFTSFGWVCETVAGLKNAGGACPKNLSAPESIQLWESGVQQRLFFGLGTYFDNMNLIKNDPAKFEVLKNDLALVVEKINAENASLVEQCEERKNSKVPVFAAVKNIFETTLYDHISDPSKCNEAKVKALKKLLTPDSEILDDRFTIVPSNETLGRFNQLIENDPKILKDLESYANTPDSRLKNYADLVTNLGPKLNALLLELIPDEAVKLECKNVPEGESAFLSGEIQDKTRSFILMVKSNKETPCKDLLQPYVLEDMFNPSNKACTTPANIDVILSAIRPLMEMESELNQKTLPALLNPESRYADQIIRAIMPGCLDQSKLINVNDLACATFPTCDPTGKFDDNNSYAGPKGGCHSFDQAKKMMRTKTLAGINQGRALAISACTAFIKNPDIKSNFCREGLPAGERHNMHEMTMTGYRCHSGKIEYEIVNSWGTDCEDNKNIECQKDADGISTGPFWVKEDVIVDNSNSLTTISVKKK